MSAPEYSVPMIEASCPVTTPRGLGRARLALSFALAPLWGAALVFAVPTVILFATLRRVLSRGRGRGSGTGTVADASGSLPAGLLGLLVLLGGAPPAAAQSEPCFDCHDVAHPRHGLKPVGRSDRARTPEGRQDARHGARVPCVTCHLAQRHLPHSEGGTLDQRRLVTDMACRGCHRRTVLPAAHVFDTPCITCHREHDNLDGTREPQVCAACHEPEGAALAASAHLRSVRQGDGTGLQASGFRLPVPWRSWRLPRSAQWEIADSLKPEARSLKPETSNLMPEDAPVHCRSCHTVHGDQGRDLKPAQASARCLGCHDDEERMAPFGLSTAVADSYLRDFHGQEYLFGDPERPREIPQLECSDCHGVHDVFEMDAAGRARIAGRLHEVCARCHGAGAVNLPAAWLSHHAPSPDHAVLTWGVRWLYRLVIPFILAGLGLHVGMMILRWRRHPVRPDPALAADRRRFRRFGCYARLEHAAVMPAFLLLILTGLPQKYPRSAWAAPLVARFGDLNTTRGVHRAAGAAFAVLAVLHALWWGGRALWLRRRPAVFVSKGDFRDLWQAMAFLLGRRAAPPAFGYFGYQQKFEYWGMALGGTLMIVTGLLLMYPNVSGEYLAGALIPAAKAAHSYEALLALGVLLVWHLLGTHLDPRVFPMDASIFRGWVSARHMQEFHALEYEALAGAAPVPPEPAPGAEGNAGTPV